MLLTSSILKERDGEEDISINATTVSEGVVRPSSGQWLIKLEERSKKMTSTRRSLLALLSRFEDVVNTAENYLSK